jgi:hypothetical protein
MVMVMVVDMVVTQMVVVLEVPCQLLNMLNRSQLVERVRGACFAVRAVSKEVVDCVNVIGEVLPIQRSHVRCRFHGHSIDGR